MCSMKTILLGFLVLAVCQTVLSKPSTPSADEAKEEADDYVGDDDYQYNDDNDDENKSGQTNKDDNSVHAPPYFESSQIKKSAKVGDNIVIECGAKNLAAANVVMWYNQTTLITQSKFKISDDSRLSVDDNYSLRINGVRATDASQYYCKVLPNDISMQVNLDVESKPTAVILDKEGRNISGRQMTYHQGDRIEIECRGMGNPVPQIKWFSKGERVASGNNVQVNNGFLIIEHADHDHVKLYQCLADNGKDDVGHATFSINVQYSPKVNAHRHIVNTKEGDDAELHCNYKSTTMSRVTWHKNKESLRLNNLDKYSTSNETKDEHHESNILVIKNVERSDLGEYECEVQNSIGKGHVRIHLGYEPEPPKFERFDIDGDTIITHWKIRSLQPLNEVMLNYQKNGDRNWLSEKPVHSEKSKEHSGIWRIQHKLSLDSGTWNARVKAKNADGWSLYSDQETIVVPTKPVIQKAGIGASSAVSIYQLSSAVCLVSLLLATLRI
ncbi:lachesin-like isoform X2 [Bradysia coprophila]|uniref:lachesin-like isoform X2 n=1 Tax=Bradysia coprophila TaxID=38358 RepID=UPI00187D7081|nr:lachesin-like isoform X2 [Bradysia coprophila]